MPTPGPSIDIRHGTAGIDSRRGFSDMSANACSDMRNFQFREKSIKKRLGHQKMHDDAVKKAGLIWKDTDTSVKPVRIQAADLHDLDSAGGWSFEFSFRFTALPSSGPSPRTLFAGGLNARLQSTGVIEVGADTGGGAVYLASATTLSVNTDYFISVTYDDSGAGTLELYIDGVSDATDAAYGTPILPDTTVRLRIGGLDLTPTEGDVVISEVRIWDDLRTSAEVAQFDGIQLPSEVYSNDTELVHYWRMDEGTGLVLDDKGDDDKDITFCYDSTPEGLVSGSSGALRAADIDGIETSIIGWTGELGEVGSATENWNYYANANDMTWEFAIRFDELPSDTSAWTYRLMNIGSLAQGIEFFLDSPVASTDVRFRFDYTDTSSAGADDWSVIATGTVLAINTTYYVSLTVDRTGVPDRDVILYVNGVSGATSSGNTDDASNTLVGSDDFAFNLSKSADVGTFGVQFDEMRLWKTTRAAADILAAVDRTLYPGEIADPNLTAYWTFDEKLGRTRPSLKPVPGTTGSGDFTSLPNLVLTILPCPEWASGGVVAEAPCIRGIHNYINNNTSLNQVIVHGLGASYRVDEDTSTLVALTPFSPAGSANVSSSRFGRDGSRSYFADGSTRPWRWDGENLFQAGIESPPSQPFLSASTGGAGWPTGDYLVGYTYLSTSGERNYESAMSPVGTFTLSVAAVDLTISNILISPDQQVDKIQVYISKVNGSVLIKSQVFANASGSVTVDKLEADLDIANAEAPNHSAPIKFKYMIERDRRMIWAGSDEAPRLFFWSEVDFPEYVGVLNSREHSEEVTGVALGANNELFVFGKTSRTVVLGDVTDPRTPQRTFKQGGCLSHHSLTNIETYVYGMGADGPFRCNSHVYQPIDEIQLSSIRQTLEDNTDKDFWEFSWAAYDPDKKTWYLSVPANNTRDRSVIYPLQIDIAAWTRYGAWDCEGAVTLRQTANGFVETLGTAVRGFVCQLEKEGYKDGLTDAQSHSYTVSSVDTGENSITLTATPPATGDGVKGLIIWVYTSATRVRSNQFEISFQDGAKLYLDGSVSGYSMNDTVFIGVYDAVYETKAWDGRTMTKRKKLFRWYEDEHNQESSGSLKLVFERLDEIDTKGFQTTAIEGGVDYTLGRAGRFPIHISSERLIVKFGNIEPDPIEIFGYNIDYEQAGIV